MSIPYVTRSNPDKQNLLSEIENTRNKNITSELASLKSELQENYSWLNTAKSWLNTAKKIALTVGLVYAAASCLYECYHLEQSNETIYQLKFEYGKEEWRIIAQEIFKKIEAAQPSWHCTIGAEKVSLIDCFARGMAHYFKNKD